MGVDGPDQQSVLNIIYVAMGRRGNPYDKARADSLLKTLEVDAVRPTALRHLY